MFGWFKKKPHSRDGPDFSTVDSRAKAEALFARGQLEKLLLMPLEFGGEDIPENTLYVPVGLASVKEEIDRNVIGPLVAEGKLSRYSATPEYQGKSFIPISVSIEASDPGDFSTTISIWGAALRRK